MNPASPAIMTSASNLSPTSDGGDFNPQPRLQGPSLFPTFFFAIRNQLGLKLEAQKGPVEVVVVDHADQAPVAN